MCFINHAYPPSTTPLLSLNPLSISDLSFETHHEGRVLFVRTASHPLHVLCHIQSLVEDGSGDVERVALYNQIETVALEQVLPNNCVFAIKEPFYTSTADGVDAIRIDHPSDLVHLKVTDALFPKYFFPQIFQLDESAKDCKISGNAVLTGKKYDLARQLYTRGLQLSESTDEMTRDLLRNRALANLYLGRYEEAEADARASIIESTETIDSRGKSLNKKALYRAGRALYELRKFQEADEAFLGALELTPDDRDAMREHDRCSLRLQEQTCGKYDFKKMSKAAAKASRLDHADFTCNTAVRTAGNRGRGLFAAKDIKAGDLILCEKAFQAVFRSECKVYLTTNINTERGHIGCGADLLFRTIEKLRCNPSAASRFLDLYDGGYQPKCPPTLVDNTTVVDSYQVQAINEHNCFGCPEVRSSDQYVETSETPSELVGSAGSWITASYINHECVGNACHSFMGDMMIVRAVGDIARDEEITMPYRNREVDSEESGKLLKELWGFECDCALCVADRKTPAAQRAHRIELLDQAYFFMSESRSSTARNGQPQATDDTIKRAKQVYRALEKTYDGDHYQTVPRLGLINLGVWLSQMTSSNRQCADTATAVLRNAGFQIEVKNAVLNVQRTRAHLDSAVVDAAMHAGIAYKALDQPGVGKQFDDLGRELHRTLVGELRGFNDRYQRFFLF